MDVKAGGKIYIVKKDYMDRRVGYDAIVLSVKKKYAEIDCVEFQGHKAFLDISDGSVLDASKKNFLGNAYFSRREFEKELLLNRVWNGFTSMVSMRLWRFNAEAQGADPDQFYNAIKVLVGSEAYRVILDNVKTDGLSEETLCDLENARNA